MKDPKKRMSDSLGLVFLDNLRVKCDFVREKMPSVINIRKKKYEECKCEEIIKRFPKLGKHTCSGHVIFSDLEYKEAGYKLFESDFEHMEENWTAKARFRPSEEQNIKKLTKSLVDSIEKAFNKYTVRKHNIPGWNNEGSSWIVLRSEKKEQILESCEKMGILPSLVVREDIPENGAYLKKGDKDDFENGHPLIKQLKI